MSTKIVILICSIFSPELIFPPVTSSIINNIRTGYEQLRESLDKLNNVTRVRTTAELQAKGNEFATLDFVSKLLSKCPARTPAGCCAILQIGLVQQHDGYEAEEYDVQTEDGYILKLHRIISSPHCPKEANKPVVFMQHGLLGSSDIFVNLGPSHDLAFMLADAGYDIWLGNVRGNFYSRHHVKYSPASTNYDFWEFNIDDMGLKDIPALIDAALKNANKTKLSYIGFSMGTTMNYMFLSSKPEYNDKVDLSISLAPIVYFVRPFSLFLKLLLAFRALIPLGKALRIYELLPLSVFVIFFAKRVCTNVIGFYICGLIFSGVLNFHNVNYDDMPSICSVIFNGASLDTHTHFGQLASKEKFIKFDFGPRRNQEKYNSSDPPEYDLSKVTAPQAIFYTDRDAFSSSKAIKKLKKHLKNVVAFEKVPESYYHCDLLWAKNARIEYYDKILKLIKQYSN